ncbi:selenide, water dikinase SelD [Mesobacterium sp. TK19101]|uniref:Selenide, water dikinase SelD n=1 Tax=Mesobacterium hydrothermale TaxID=3111907 RepID=A0ABU6HKQ2_9RHOB|nr:selenide, water dikinase SelD [Mesobacterium sp. TK19101]MEC3863042.1 selenide, water dikinase SelD [Mesobacterium sp. TK19101]
MTPEYPLTRDLVFVGGGHTHALVLRMWGMSPLHGARLTVINPGPTAPYSGMLPGFVAGHYDRDALDIDLVKLARFAGARVILGTVDRIDPVAKTVHVPGRPPIGYDICSVDVGITSEMPALPGFADHGTPAKPLGTFATRWAAYRDGNGPASVAVIGAGVAGVELALAMAFALKTRRRPAQVHLVEAATALSVLGAKPRARLLQAMAELNVTLHENARIDRVTATGLELAGGQVIEAGFVTGAAGTRPHGWIAGCGLDLQDGFIKVNARLQSSAPDVFATGDCAHMTHAPRPKAGVFAVRQAPVLLANLRAALAGTDWQDYQPQADYLKLISMGDKTALAEKQGLPLSGALMWRWKDWIDQRFMQKFRDLPVMKGPDLTKLRAKGDEALHKPLCTGCGSKVGRGALAAAVADLPRPRPDVTPLPGDDAALLVMGDTRQVLTTDHLSAVTADPALMARIAAVHALGDVWAMGAAPQAALAQIVLPRMSADLQQRTLSEIMAVAGEVMADAGAQIVGGHTTMGAGMTIGFSITGLLERDPITLAGARPGDALILTKPIGTGVVLAAEMAGQARGADVAACFANMSLAQGNAARILSQAHAMTDVTGFGLAGHLQGICAASGVGAEIAVDAIPVLPGARALSDSGVASSLYPDNRALVPGVIEEARTRLLFDPQTCGGLLAVVDAGQAAILKDKLKIAGYDAAIIGKITPDVGQVSIV